MLQNTSEDGAKTQEKFWKMELGYLSHTHLFFIPLLYSIYKQNNNRRGENGFRERTKQTEYMMHYDE